MNSPILNVAIGLVFIYTLYSLLVTILNEIVATTFSLRAHLLAKAIDRMLEEENEHYWQALIQYRIPQMMRRIRIAIYNVLPFWKKLHPGKASQSFADEFYQMPVIKYLGEGKIFNRFPAYITASTFSKTVVELLEQKGAALNGISSAVKSDDIRLFLENNSDSISPEMRNHLFSLLKALKDDMDKFKQLLCKEVTDQRQNLLGLLNTAKSDTEKFKTELQKLPIPLETSLTILALVDKADTSIDALKNFLSEQNLSGETLQVLASASNHAKANAEIFRRLVERGNVSLETRQMLLAMFNEAKGDVDVFRKLLEKWFNEMMDRVKGWYRKKTKVTTFAFGFLLAVIFNVNTIQIVSKLSSDKTSATQLADLAKTYVETNKSNPRFIKKTGNTTDTVLVRDSLYDKKLRDSIQVLLSRSKALIEGDISSTNEIMGLGWNFKEDSVPQRKNNKKGMAKVLNFFDHPMPVIERDVKYILRHTNARDWLGFLLTALAISLGAPFWFDLLSKLVQLRGSGDDTDAKQKKLEAKAGAKNPPANS
jgi:hypothetical protein